LKAHGEGKKDATTWKDVVALVTTHTWHQTRRYGHYYFSHNDSFKIGTHLVGLGLAEYNAEKRIDKNRNRVKTVPELIFNIILDKMAESVTFVTLYENRGEGSATSKEGNGIALPKAVSDAKYLKEEGRLPIAGSKAPFKILGKVFHIYGILDYSGTHQDKGYDPHTDNHIYVFLNSLFHSNGATGVRALAGMITSCITEKFAKKPQHL
jgi:hypothetical protein